MKKLITIFVLMSMVMWIAACGVASEDQETVPPANQHLNEYGVYVQKTLSEDYFTADVRDFLWSGAQQTNNAEPKELTKTETINGTTVTVVFDWTYTTGSGQTRHYYESADGKVQCVYRAEDMSLASIELREQDMSVFEDMSLEAYNQYIQNYVSQYFRESWDELTLSCLTYCYGNVEHSFVTEFADNAPLRQREFRYTKQYGSYSTTDEVKVYIAFETKSIRIWFNDHQFDSLDVEIDQNRIDAAIYEFFNNYLVEGVTLESFEHLSSILVYSKDNLMCRVNLKAFLIQNGERRERDYSFYVDIPDGN